MYLDGSFYKQFPSRHSIAPRERYREYYQDLHARYQLPIENETFVAGSQYKFSELAQPVLDFYHNNGYLQNIDLLALASWAPEYDADFSVSELQLTYKNKISCDMVDVIDHGSLCTIMVLFLICQHQKIGKSKLALCLAVDQNTIPRVRNSAVSLPSYNAALGFIISALPSNNASLKIIDVYLCGTPTLLEFQLDCLSLIKERLNAFEVELSECVICCKQNTTVFKAIQYYKNKKEFYKRVEFIGMPLQWGAACGYQLINDLYSKKWRTKKHYLIYLEEDMESLNLGMIIFDMSYFNESLA